MLKRVAQNRSNMPTLLVNFIRTLPSNRKFSLVGKKGLAEANNLVNIDIYPEFSLIAFEGFGKAVKVFSRNSEKKIRDTFYGTRREPISCGMILPQISKPIEKS